MTNNLNVLASNSPTSDTALALNESQRVLLAQYCDGEFSYLAQLASQADFNREVADCGDGLLRFLIAELASSEDCRDMETGRDRVVSAMRSLQVLCEAFESELERAVPAARRQSQGM